MGARSSIIVRFPHDAEITLYTHSHGREVARIVREGLAIAAEEGRAEDPSHLAWVYATLLHALDRESRSGFAISPHGFLTDPEYGDYHVDPMRGVVEHVVTAVGWDGSDPSFETRHVRAASFAEAMDGALDAPWAWPEAVRAVSR